MALDDLDLEFEDEDEAKKKKSDAVQVDVDLEFHLPGSAPKPRPTRPAEAAPASSAPAGRAASPSNMGVVKKLEEARPQIPAMKKPLAGSPGPAPSVQGSSALKIQEQDDVRGDELTQLREQVRKTQFDADVRVQVAEFKTEVLSDLLSDIKLMDHQIGQLLSRIHAKHPDMKQEVLMIKKILADFTTKKRK
jgi:hypothetical protein